MGRQVPFGDILRDAREREGLDLNTAARKLHIRPDILRAIEDSDFARMPPRGYTRNMVNAYARLVGLNASQMSSLYADQAYAFEVGRSRSDELRLDSRSRSGASGRPSSNRPRSAASSSRSQGGYNGRTASGRGIYDDRTDMQGRAYSTRFSGGSQGRSAGSYRNVYAGGSAAPTASKLPFILIGIIVLLILIIVLVLLFGNKGQAETDVPENMPIAGLTNTANPTQGEADPAQAAQQAAQAAQPKVEEPPTKAVFTYEVPEGQSAYIEIKVGDTTSYDTASIIEGPKEKSYDVTDTLTFATTSPDSVVLTLDGEVVKPTEARQGTGVYNYTVNFSDILAQWKADHPEAEDNTKKDDDAAADDTAPGGEGSGSSGSSGDGSASAQ
ncbi:helix-turn-helix domain-containing protein [Parvibacter caecicola]|uniref:Helix-turn-helix domain-containing protein n=1 Tax=Parvibacter caecicola TaxID=747645 RepID=A0A4T9TFL5_9ACTN|nr:helix-turn-helix transcriptional regulator [Parvibacter caecicola]TJW12118.1 helix-turn-helix domain-containing protein [Parvibacter caecicola]